MDLLCLARGVTRPARAPGRSTMFASGERSDSQRSK
jgi:hypothetical protein